MPQAPKILNTFESIKQIITDLRGPGGCPWDQEQTHLTLAPFAIEETHEMVEAIESGDDAHICEELGDVLFQVMIHAELASERKAFDISDVIYGINSKIVRRHPHVFAGTQVNSTDEVIKNWDEIKKQEKLNSPQKKKIFDVPENLPALQRSAKIGEKTNKYKFDWSEKLQVINQLKAEIKELEDAILENDEAHIRHEMGDVLFSAAQLARHLNIEPESNLREANRRFIGRFEKMVSEAGNIENFIKSTNDEKEQLWVNAKKQ